MAVRLCLAKITRHVSLCIKAERIVKKKIAPIAGGRNGVNRDLCDVNKRGHPMLSGSIAAKLPQITEADPGYILWAKEDRTGGPAKASFCIGAWAGG